MPLVQGLIYFTSIRVPQGWTESWYANTDINTMLNSLNSIVVYRQQFLSLDYQIVATRASTVNPPRQSKLVVFATPSNGLTPTSDEPGDCILYRVSGSLTNARRQVPFRGIAENWVFGGQLSNAGRAGLSLIDSYLRNVANQSLGLRVPDGTQPRIQVVSIASQAGLLMPATITLANTPVGWVDHDLIRIRNCKRNPLFNGLWRITALNTGALGIFTATLIGSDRYQVLQTGNATVQKVIQAFEPFGTFNFIGPSFRKTGRPFGLRRGRIPAKILHR